MIDPIVKEIETARRRAGKAREKRDNAAATLRMAGYTSSEVAMNVSVQASRIRQYVTAGTADGKATTVADFTDAFNAWAVADAKLDRLRGDRDEMIVAGLTAGEWQETVGERFGVGQDWVSRIARTHQRGMLI